MKKILITGANSYIGTSFEKYIACIANVCLNFIFIPILGATGAALASLLTQVMTCIVIPLFFMEMRPNVKLMFDGIFFIETWFTKK